MGRECLIPDRNERRVVHELESEHGHGDEHTGMSAGTGHGHEHGHGGNTRIGSDCPSSLGLRKTG